MSRIMTTAAAVAALLVACPVAAEGLRPDQKAAVEQLLAGMEPSMREPMRAQVEQSIAMLTKDQVAALLADMGNDGSGDAQAYDEAEEEAVLSPEDAAYNRAQYEPVIRRSWQAQKAFDDHVDAGLAAKCPGRDQYAVYGAAVRYEVRQLAPNWPRASQSADTDVTVISGSYAPQDGRYDFDFSAVRTNYDKAAVDAAITSACADWTRVAAEFHGKASALYKAGNLDGAYRTEQEYGPKVRPIEEALEAVLQREAPSANNAVFMALMNGTPAN